MTDLDDSFTRLLGRQPTDKERQALYRVRDALKLNATDAVWLLLMALQHYETLYERVPERIANAARDATKTVRATAEAQVAAAREETKRGLTDAVRDGAIDIAREVAGAERFKWASIGVGLALLSLLVVAIWQHRQGEAKGQAEGENAAKRECAYATAVGSWALTPDGQRAYALEKVGSLHDLVNCTGRGLERKGDWCVVQTDRGKPVHRWRLPGGS
jgi:hypothetical protein